MTKAHNDRINAEGTDKGYSIRVGKKLPTNSTNLAYVYTQKMSPKANLLINDASGKIKENGLPSNYQKERLMLPDDSFLLRELSGGQNLPSKNIIITDEFSIPNTTQDEPLPLYYRAKVKGYFDARGATVSAYVGGYTNRPTEKAVDYAQLSNEEKEDMLYLGSKIQITNLDGTPLPPQYKYKVHLVKEEGPELPQNSYSIYIYTNFRGSKDETFVVRYEKYELGGRHTGDYVEILNAYPFFTKTDKASLDALALAPKENDAWKTALSDQEYAVVEAGEGSYEVYAPSQVVVANNVTRPAHQFKYKIKGDLKTRFSVANPGSVNIGIAYLNTSVFNVENLTSSIWKLFEDKLKPPYVDFSNPHPPSIDSIKESSRYWTIDLAMPADSYDDFDVIILTGYGFYDLSNYNDSLRRFLENGGKIWVDNAGTGENVLTFKDQDGTETFLSSVGFSSTSNESGVKSSAIDGTGYLDRMYVLNGENLDIGYAGVNPKITFGSGEVSSSWKKVLRYTNNSPSIIYKKMYDKGILMFSNCGVFRSLSHSEEVDIKFAINTILSYAEEKTIHTPWIQDYVYHRDNLFTEEYTEAGGQTLYLDDRDDIDSSQIVAKKVLSKATKLAIQPFLPKSFYSAKGQFYVEVESDTEIIVPNGSAEVGSFDKVAGTSATEWTVTKTDAIPGWSTSHVAGSTPLFKHITSMSQRGTKAIQIDAPADGIGSHAFWYQRPKQLIAGSYRATTWVRVSNAVSLSGSGVVIAAYTMAGLEIATSNAILGTRDWVKVEVDFSITKAQDVDIRIGFADGNGSGTIVIDFLSLYGIGSVRMTPPNDGGNMLYAYAVKARGDSINLQAEGFATSDITTYDPQVDVTYTIRSFVYSWDNYLGRYMREYGKYSTYKKKIRRSDGVVSLGSVSTLIPELPGGAQWANRNKIYYEVFLGGAAGVDADSRFVNFEIYDAESGKYFFSKEGEIIIRHNDLFKNGEQKQIILQARTNYYTIRATKRRYGVLVQDDMKIELSYPSTIDDRDCWFLRVRNGAFTKKELSYSDLIELRAYDSRYYQYQQRIFGTHHYALPEYDRQVFKPVKGIKKEDNEIAEYVNDNTIRLQNAPLYIKQGFVRGEEVDAVDPERRIFQAENNGWTVTYNPKVYVDEDENGSYIEVVSGFKFDYERGCVIFAESVTGNVKVDYNFNNLKVTKRTFNNNKVNRERLTTSDSRTFVSKNLNWMAFPTPILKTVPYANKAEENIIPTSSFAIDYDSGVVTFKEDINEQVYADYSHSTDTELIVRDYDTQNGLIYLENPIDFKDEIYVDYYYEENFVEYRGYFDSEFNSFVHLDVNPSEGHYCTMRVNRNGQTIWEQVPTAKLMNKEVYMYVLPYFSSFGSRNQHTIRHCYSLAEWQQVQKTTPTALLLGVVHLREHTKVGDAVVLDTRTRGGGLKEKITDKEIKQTEPLSYNYWDMGTWDGKAYYKNGTIIVQIPKKVLRVNGGQFVENEIRDIVGKYIAYGVYFIIEYV